MSMLILSSAPTPTTQLNATIFGSKFVILMFARAYVFVRAIHDSSLLVRHRDQIGTNA